MIKVFPHKFCCLKIYGIIKDGFCTMIYKIYKFQANWKEIWCNWFSRINIHSIKMTIKSRFIDGSQNPLHLIVMFPKLTHRLLKFDLLDLDLNLEVIGQNMI